MYQVSRVFQLCVYATLGFSGFMHPSIAGDGDRVKDIIRRWEMASTAIKTAKVKCFHANLSAHFPDDDEISTEKAVETSLTSEQFRVLFQDKLVPLVGSPDVYPAMKREVSEFVKKTGKADIVWSELRIVQDGPAARNDERYAVNRFLRLSTPKRCYSYDAGSSTAFISDNGRNDGISLESAHTARELRFTPVIQTSVAEQMKVEILTPGHQARLVGEGGEIFFETQSGFVTHAVLRNGPNGTIQREFWQALPRKYRGDVEMPSISATITYQNTAKGEPRLDDADIFVIEAAEFNQEIPPADLTLPVPKGTSIEDWTGSTGPLTTDEDIANLASFVFPAVRRASRSQLPKSNFDLQRP